MGGVFAEGVGVMLDQWRVARDEKPQYRTGALVFTHRHITTHNPIGHCEYRIAVFAPTNIMDPESWTWTDPYTGAKIDDVTHWIPLPDAP